jgi:hypothetical protein
MQAEIDFLLSNSANIDHGHPSHDSNYHHFLIFQVYCYVFLKYLLEFFKILITFQSSMSYHLYHFLTFFNP